MTKKITVGVALTITLIAVTVAFAITWLVATEYFNRAVQSITQKQATYSKLLEADTYVRNNYYGTIDDEVLGDLIVQGYLLGTGDPYAVYYTEEQYTAYQAFENGSLVDVGIEVSKSADGLYYIERVYAESPAEKAGVRAGGYILSIDDVDVKTLTSAEAAKRLMRGEEGSELVLECVYDQNENESFEIQRVNYAEPTVEYQKVGDFGYIRIDSFGKNTSVELNAAVLRAQSDEVQGLVLDVRGNEGGDYQQMYNAADYLAPRGTIAQSLAKNGTIRVLATSNDETQVNLPMTVLVNGDTAAAAELFAFAVRDLCNADVVGETSAGQGMMQNEPQQLTDGSAISVTIAELLTGDEQPFNELGIVPDIEVPVDAANQNVNLFMPNLTGDPQILRALEVLRNATGDNNLSIVYEPPVVEEEGAVTQTQAETNSTQAAQETEAESGRADGGEMEEDEGEDTSTATESEAEDEETADTNDEDENE